MTTIMQNENESSHNVSSVPPFRFGPATWNLLYYAILGASLLVGFLALLNGAPAVDALLYFFVALIGTAFLGITFLSFVVAPLYIKSYERAVRARREALRRAKIMAIEREERMHAERYRGFPSQSDEGTEVEMDETFTQATDTVQPDGTASPVMEDQASSLRRMVAAEGGDE